jgi:hypothetical protein
MDSVHPSRVHDGHTPSQTQAGQGLQSPGLRLPRDEACPALACSAPTLSRGQRTQSRGKQPARLHDTVHVTRAGRRAGRGREAVDEGASVQSSKLMLWCAACPLDMICHSRRPNGPHVRRVRELDGLVEIVAPEDLRAREARPSRACALSSSACRFRDLPRCLAPDAQPAGARGDASRGRLSTPHRQLQARQQHGRARNTARVAVILAGGE